SHIFHQLGKHKTSSHRWVKVRTISNRQGRCPVISACHIQEQHISPRCSKLTVQSEQPLIGVGGAHKFVTIHYVFKAIKLPHDKIIPHPAIVGHFSLFGKETYKRTYIQLPATLIEVGH